MNNTSDALKIIRRSPLVQPADTFGLRSPQTRAWQVTELSIDKDPELLAMLKDSSVIAQVSMIIYDVRKQAGLTQRQLADLVGTTRSVNARLEDADYDGHSLSMLARIASALGQKLEIKMLPKEVA
jgi:ribosome-binding protein aMBF1 (putative translation factor)